MKRNFEAIIDRICEQDIRYKRDAYVFVMEALNFTQKKFRRTKHVSGQELLDGMRELLLNKYGPLTLTVLAHWGIETTDDFGNIVFNLVEHRVLSKTQDDHIDNFRNAYDFREVFQHGYRKQLERRISRMRSA